MIAFLKGLGVVLAFALPGGFIILALIPLGRYLRARRASKR